MKKSNVKIVFPTKEIKFSEVKEEEVQLLVNTFADCIANNKVYNLTIDGKSRIVMGPGLMSQSMIPIDEIT